LANWSTQKAWAEGLDFADSTDWRLPEISEYGALFTAYGNLTSVTNFTNVQSNYYWSGTEYVPDPDGAWSFNSGVGVQSSGGKLNALYVVAVRPPAMWPPYRSHRRWHWH